jgi:hypothetical protein
MLKTTIIFYFCGNNKFTPMKRILPIALFLCSAFLMKAQIPITNFYPLDSVYFNFNTYTGAGFQPIPVAGQLSSASISIKPGGTVNPPLYFGGTQNLTSSIYAKGTSANPVSTGGFYSFKVNPLDTVNKSFGFQQSANVMSGSPGSPSNGMITLKFKNLTPKPIYKFKLSYDMYVRPDQARSTLIKLQGGNDTLSQTLITNGTYVSPKALITLAPWQKDSAYDFLVNNVNIPVGGEYYLSFLVSDSAGTGSRDEIAIDNLKLKAIDSIIVSPSVVINANFTVSAVSVCKGSSVSFTNTTTTIPANIPLVYIWSFRDGGFDSIASPTHQFDSVGTFNVLMYAFDTVSFILDSHVVSIQVNPLPNANFATTNTGAAYTFTSSASPVNLTYQWYLNGTAVTTSTPAVYNNTFATNGANTVCLRLKNSISGCKDSVCKTINVIIPPINTLNVNIALSNAVICQGDSVALTTLSISGGTPPLVSNWFINGNPASAPVIGVYNQVNNPGPRTVVLVVTDSNNFTKSDTALLTVNPKPNANFTATASSGNNLQYIINSSAVGSNLTYVLFVNGTPNTLVGSSPFLFTFPVAGTYSTCLKVTSASGCIDSTCKSITVIPNALENINRAENLKLYPNPAKDYVVIENLKDRATVKIYNAIGQTVKEEIVSSSANKINVKELQAGLYFVAVKSNTASKTIRLVIQ